MQVSLLPHCSMNSGPLLHPACMPAMMPDARMTLRTWCVVSFRKTQDERSLLQSVEALRGFQEHGTTEGAARFDSLARVPLRCKAGFRKKGSASRQVVMRQNQVEVFRLKCHWLQSEVRAC